jgi:hypothetical protein
MMFGRKARKIKLLERKLRAWISGCGKAEDQIEAMRAEIELLRAATRTINKQRERIDDLKFTLFNVAGLIDQVQTNFIHSDSLTGILTLIRDLAGKVAHDA